MKINPHHQFNPTQTSLAEVLSSQYGLTLQNFEPARSGIENTTVIVNCAEGQFVARFYRQMKKTDEHIEQELGFMKYLRQQNFKIPLVVKNQSGEELTKYTEGNTTWQVMLMEFAAGHHATSYTPALVINLATIQARMHLVSGSYSNRYLGFVLRNLRETHFLRSVETANIPDPALRDFIQRAKQYQVHLDTDLPFGLCHLDFDADNTLVDEHDEITAILDFDDLALAPFVVDLAYALWDLYYAGGESLTKSYVSAYEKIRPLSDLEKSCINEVLLFRHYLVSAVFLSGGEVTSKKAKKLLEMEADLIAATRA